MRALNSGYEPGSVAATFDKEQQRRLAGVREAADAGHNAERAVNDPVIDPQSSRARILELEAEVERLRDERQTLLDQDRTNELQRKNECLRAELDDERETRKEFERQAAEFFNEVERLREMLGKPRACPRCGERVGWRAVEGTSDE